MGKDAILLNEDKPPIELNKHYQPDAISIQCGSSAYYALSKDYEALARVWRTICTSYTVQVAWTMRARRSGNVQSSHVEMKGSIVRLRIARQAGTVFLDYAEVREIADKLLASGNFEEITIEERLYKGEKDAD